jgi:hypothetical protein
MPDVTSIGFGISQVSDQCMKDTTQPPKLVVEYAAFGDLIAQPNNTRRDPLVLRFMGMEPGCKLEFMNISEKPNCTWASDAKALTGPIDRCLHDGKLGVLFATDEAKKLGIQPGDIFEVRQVDASGNASEPTRIKLVQQNINWTNFDTRPNAIVGAVNFTPGWNYYLQAYGDARAPVVLNKHMQIKATEAGKAVLTGDRAMEPGVTVVVHNERTIKDFSAVVDDAGKLVVNFEAQVGDPLHVSARDHNGNSVDLGVFPYAPSCVKAGPLAQNQLQDQGQQG